MTVKLATANLNGKKIAYGSQTQFLVQVGGKGKSGYRTIKTCTGNLAEAVQLYNALLVGVGRKKRLLMPSSPKPVLARFVNL